MSFESLCTEILTIGTELLQGETIDTNKAAIAQALGGIGLEVGRITTVGDDVEQIACAVRESLARADLLITSGGLGPTVDDVTREGIAAALDVPTEFRTELWEHIKAIFAAFGREPTENNRRQAVLPKNATAILNPVGTAPAFRIETPLGTVIALPGVPAELKVLLAEVVIPFVRRDLGTHQAILTRLLRTVGLGESWIDDRIRDLIPPSNPTIGLAAHPGRVDLRITSRAPNREQAAKMTQELQARLTERLGSAVYGVDGDTLESVVRGLLERRGWRIAVVQSGTPQGLDWSIESLGAALAGRRTLPSTFSNDQLEEQLIKDMDQLSAELGLAFDLKTDERPQVLTCLLRTASDKRSFQRTYAGHPENAPAWAASLALNIVRKYLTDLDLP